MNPGDIYWVQWPQYNRHPGLIFRTEPGADRVAACLISESGVRGVPDKEVPPHLYVLTPEACRGLTKRCAVQCNTAEAIPKHLVQEFIGSIEGHEFDKITDVILAEIKRAK